MPRGIRKPTRLKLAEGDLGRVGMKKLRQKLAREPRATPGLQCPKHLTGLAREMFLFWAAELKAMEQNFRPDSAVLACAARSYERAVAADAAVLREGRTVQNIYRDKSGKRHVLGVRVNPEVTVGDNAWKMVRQCLEQFGLTPVSRTRIVTKEQEAAEDALERILNAPRPAKPKLQGPSVQ